MLDRQRPTKPQARLTAGRNEELLPLQSYEAGDVFYSLVEIRQIEASPARIELISFDDGLLAFGGVQRWHPPRKGGDPVRRLLEQTYDLQSSPAAADYLVAARELLSRQERRALVLLLTNVRDEDQAELQQAVAMLVRRHLVLVADLREAALDAVFDQPVRDLDGALRLHAVYDYLERRRLSHQRLRHQGALALDLLPSQLPAALVNQYFDIKSSGRL